MSDDRQNRDDSNKTLMFDPGQIEAFKKMARLARQQADQGAVPTPPAASAGSSVSMPVNPQAPRTAPPSDQDVGNKTMMFGAAELAQLRPVSGAPIPQAPVRPITGPTTIAIDPTKTLPLDGPAPAPMHAFGGHDVDPITALRSGLDTALGVSRTPTPPMGIPVVHGSSPKINQIQEPAPSNQPIGNNETVAYSPEQMARLRAGIPAPEAGGQTMMYNANENADLREAFDMLKRHQTIESQRQSQARSDAEAMLRGVGDEPVAEDAPTQPSEQHSGYLDSHSSTPMGQASVPMAAPVASPFPSSPVHGASGRQHLPLTSAPSQPWQAALRSGTTQFETGKPRKSNAGKVLLVVLLVGLGAVIVAGCLHYAGVIELPFSFLPKL